MSSALFIVNLSLVAFNRPMKGLYFSRAGLCFGLWFLTSLSLFWGGVVEGRGAPPASALGHSSWVRSGTHPKLKEEEMLVYVGTYTHRNSRGIYRLRLDSETGSLTVLGLAAETLSPSFLALHSNRKFLYAVNETGSGSVSSFSIDSASGTLTFLNQRSSQGASPCHLSLDGSGRNLLVANYTGGTVVVFPVGEDGRLEQVSAREDHKAASVDSPSHPHSIRVAVGDRFAFAADAGLDRIFLYRFDPDQGSLKPHKPPWVETAAGSGPRHLTFHPNGRYAYVINETNSTVTAFSYAPEQGMLKEVQTISTLPKGFEGNSHTAEVQVSPSGLILYGSNRGHDSIAVFRIDPETGKLTPLQHQATGGKTPRNFGIEPAGRFLLVANQESDNVVVFRINPKTGILSPTGRSVEVSMPSCVKFLLLSQ